MSDLITSRTTSTPKKLTEETNSDPEPEQSSTVLKSLLGVSPVTPQKESDSSSVENAKTSTNNDSGFVSMSKSPSKSLSFTQPSSIRGILRSSNPGNNSNLTLQQVIQRIAGGKSSGATESANRVTRSRSFSLSDVTEILSPKTKSISIKENFMLFLTRSKK